MTIIRCITILALLAVAVNGGMLSKMRGSLMGTLEGGPGAASTDPSCTKRGTYDFTTVSKETKLAAGAFATEWCKGLTITNMPMRDGSTTTLTFTLTKNGNNYELQTMDNATDADGVATEVNIIHLTLEEPTYDERSLNLNMEMSFTEEMGSAALARMEEKKKTGAVHASDKIAWCYLAEIGNYYKEDCKSKREFVGTQLAKLASDLCDLAGYAHQSLDDGARFRECKDSTGRTHTISHMARMVNVFSQGLTFYAKAGFAPCGTRMFEYSRLVPTRRQYCDSMRAILTAKPSDYNHPSCRGDTSKPFDDARPVACPDTKLVGECYLEMRDAKECTKMDAIYKNFLDVRPSSAYGVEAANLNACPIAKHLAYIETIPRYCRTRQSASAAIPDNNYCNLKQRNGAACKLPGECISTQCKAGRCCAASGASATADDQCCSGKAVNGKCCAPAGEVVTKAEMCCQIAGAPGPSGKMRCECAAAGKVVELKSQCCSNNYTVDKQGTKITKRCT